MIRTTPVYIQSKENHTVFDCATGGDSTSGGVFTGTVIDLQALPSRFSHAQAVIAGTLPGATSTAGANRISLDVRMQHGDSSGGGDMANFSTDQLPIAPQNYLSSERSTDLPSWSTGTLRAQYSPEPISLLGAKRYVRSGGQVTRVGATTSTAAGAIFTCHLGVNFLNGQEEGPIRNVAVMPSGDYQSRTQVVSTATST